MAIVNLVFDGLNVREWTVEMAIAEVNYVLEHGMAAEPFVTLVPMSDGCYTDKLTNDANDAQYISLRKSNTVFATVRVRAELPQATKLG